VTRLRQRQAGLGINGGTSNIQHPTLNIEYQKRPSASRGRQVTGFGKRRWNHIAHLRKMAGDGVAAFGAGFFGLPNSAKHLAIDGWWDEGSHPMFGDIYYGNIYYATISKKQANLVFRSDP
jgi:hypothetical protein